MNVNYKESDLKDHKEQGKMLEKNQSTMFCKITFYIRKTFVYFIMTIYFKIYG